MRTVEDMIDADMTERGALAHEVACRHLRGIEGGLVGALADLDAGRSFDAACGMDDSWDLPDGVTLDDVRRAILDIIDDARVSLRNCLE